MRRTSAGDAIVRSSATAWARWLRRGVDLASLPCAAIRPAVVLGRCGSSSISPTHYNADGTLHKTTRYWTSGLTLPYLKALTPPGHEVQMVDELFHDVDLDCDGDVVGITAMGPQIRRAYELADHFRARGRQGRARRHLGDAHRRGVAAPRRRGGRRRGGGGLAAAARRPRRRPQPRHLPRRPAGTTCADLPRVDYTGAAAAQVRRLQVRAGSTACTSTGRWSSRAAARTPASTAPCRPTTSAASAPGRSRR